MRAAVLAAAALALACQGGSGGSSPPVQQPITPTGELRIRDGAGLDAPFRLDALERLAIEARYQGYPGAHEVRVDVFDPDGGLFAQLRAAADADAAGAALARQKLEVRGTPIDSYRMTGRWRFVLAVDGVPLASAAAEVLP